MADQQRDHRTTFAFGVEAILDEASTLQNNPFCEHGLFSYSLPLIFFNCTIRYQVTDSSYTVKLFALKTKFTYQLAKKGSKKG